MLNFALENLGVKPENVTLLLTQEVYDQAVKHAPPLEG